MYKSIVDIQSAAAEIKRGKRRKKKKHRTKIKWSALFDRAAINIMSASATQGGHKEEER